MKKDEYEGSSRIQLTLAVVFLLVVTGGIIDLILDRPERLLGAHVVIEVGLVLLSLGAASYLAREWYLASRTVQSLERTVEEQRADRDQWRAEAGRALAGFGEAIGEQFDRWKLTPAERQVALGLLAGKSLKKMARENERSERTIRQHAISVYRKAGLHGRAELAGFFLEGLLATSGSPDEGRR